MTTKQAADIIKMLLGCLKGEIEPPKEETIEEAIKFEQDGYECLEMAIKALEQQPCEDLINQRATTCRHGGHCEWVACDKCNHYEPDTLSQQHCDDCISRQAVIEGIAEWVADGYADSEADISHISSLVTHLPPVTPKEKTGKWQIIEGLGYYTCSVCKCDSDVNSSYCPKCGAKMEGEELVEFDEEVSE